jgi:hypothetical protein
MHLLYYLALRAITGSHTGVISEAISASFPGTITKAITAGAAPTNSYTPLHQQQHLPQYNELDHCLKIPIILRITTNWYKFMKYTDEELKKKQ